MAGVRLPASVRSDPDRDVDGGSGPGGSALDRRRPGFADPGPAVSYTLHRDDGATIEAIATNLAGLAHTDTGVTVGNRYTYRVAAVVDGDEVARSAPASVTAGAGNHPVVAAEVLADRALTLGASPLVVDVAAAFRDPDGEALTYAAISSDTSVATVSVSGSMVTITPGAAGRTVVTVTATDAGGSNASASQRFIVTVGHDYDADEDGLIEIGTLAQLDAMRHDLDGNGYAGTVEAYAAAFPSPLERMGCGLDGCSGYELLTDLDFDTDGDGRAGAGDAYWNDGAGWEPIGAPYSFRGTFDGGGHAIRNLFLARGDDSGLFGGISLSGVVHNVRLLDVDVTGRERVGGLAGESSGIVSYVQATGRVSGEYHVGGVVGLNLRVIFYARSSAAVTGRKPPRPPGVYVTFGPLPGTGGLVGYNTGFIVASHATGPVTGDSDVGGLVGFNQRFISGSYATGHVTGSSEVGGLVGTNATPRTEATIAASYAAGSVEGSYRVGGLVGRNYDEGAITASYATGRVAGSGRGGGLVGEDESSGPFTASSVTASYWDTRTSGHASGSVGTGRTTSQLQSPRGYDGIYESWNVDLDRDRENDDPWDFGTSSQYPVLATDLDGDGAATWQEFGCQIRTGPNLTATTSTTTTPGRARVDLSWTAVDAGHCGPAPGVTWTVTRDDGLAVETIAANVTELAYADTSAATGARYTYQVAAVVAGGEAARSALVVVETSGNAPPMAVGTLPDRWLHVGDVAGVEVAAAFADPENDPLIYAAASSAAGVATVSVAGARVTITPVAAGAATITVTATDAGGSGASAAQTFTVTVLPSSAVDYDGDDDGLIEITTLAQLDAVRHDLGGDGAPTADGAAAYAAAFPTVGDRQACGGLAGCVGYELRENLDFDTNRNGRADDGDLYWNGGAGWEPLGGYVTTASGGGVSFFPRGFWGDLRRQRAHHRQPVHRSRLLRGAARLLRGAVRHHLCAERHPQRRSVQRRGGGHRQRRRAGRKRQFGHRHRQLRDGRGVRHG